MSRLPLWLCGLVISLVVGCSHYDEERSWSECCRLRILKEKDAPPTARNTIIKWAPSFWGDGTSMGDVGEEGRTKRRITLTFDAFLVENPAVRLGDYFDGLGMACRPKGNPTDGLRHCHIDLPVWIQCTVVISWPFGATPVPKELQKPIAAVLHMAVDLSASAVLAASAQVIPLPGGRLCHR